METINNVTPTNGACSVTQFVVTLGETMLQEKVKDWLDMEEVAYFCRAHQIQLKGEYPGAAKLETELQRFFHPTGEFYAPGLNVDAYERPKGWDRPFQIRAYSYWTAPKTISARSLTPDAANTRNI